MLFPSKVTSYNESLFPKLIFIANHLKNKKSIKSSLLYKEIQNDLKDINDLIETLDILFALGHIKLNIETGELYYVN